MVMVKSSALLANSVLMIMISPVFAFLSDFIIVTLAKHPPVPLIGNVLLLFGFFIVPLIYGIVCIIAGILGIVFRKKPEKAKSCVAMGFIAILCNAGHLAIFALGGIFASALLYFLLNSIIPTCYIIAAYKYSKNICIK